MGKYEVQVTVATALHYRTGPSVSYRSLGTIRKGQKFISSKQQNGWYYLDSLKGWSSGVSGNKYMKVIKDLNEKKQPAKKVKVPETKKDVTVQAQSTGVSQGIDAKVLQMLSESVMKRTQEVDASMRLFGNPHQFTKQTDFRLGANGYDLGRKYMESILSEAPIVHFLPGRANFLPNVAKEEKDAFKTFIGNQTQPKENKDAISKILGNDDVRYFDFISDYSTYIKYVNLLCRTAAIYMGLGSTMAPIDSFRQQYKWFDWSNYRYRNAYSKKKSPDGIFDAIKNAASTAADLVYEGLFGEWQYVQFYVNPNTSFTESTTNQTMQSALAGALDKGQDLVKEISFITQAGGMANVDSLIKNMGEGLTSIGNAIPGDHIFSRIFENSGQIIQGSNVIFPEIWGDAAFNKSYNININLVSPYGDRESVYLNIIVPLMHLIALALPRQTTANTFTNPFLIKASAKGWFSCELGIIDNISIEKVQGSYTVNGMPTEMKVNISIKDLYSSLMLTPSNAPAMFFENKGLMNWLAVTCGVDITEPNFSEKWKAIMLTLLNSVIDIPNNVANSIVESVRSKVEGLYKI
jgi:hypothetical protein